MFRSPFLPLVPVFLTMLFGCSEADPALTVLTELYAEEPGANCASGGTRIATGSDRNRNQTLEEDEVQVTRFICNGKDGVTTLTTVVSLPPGDSCPQGGQTVTTCNDDGHGACAEGSSSTVHVCNGAPGADAACAGNRKPSIDAIAIDGVDYAGETVGLWSNASLAVTVRASDADGDALQILLSGANALVSQPSEDSFRLSLPTVGVYPLSILVTDGCELAMAQVRLGKGATFTHCGQTGRLGPSQEQCGTAYAGTPLQGAVTVVDGIQKWIVPQTGTYRIRAFGAQGATAHASFGQGAIIQGDVELVAGTVLWILAGQKGAGDLSGEPPYQHLGGGGGTFVAKGEALASSEPLVVAGGGGACGLTENCSPSNGSATAAGNPGYNGLDYAGGTYPPSDATNNLGGTNGAAGGRGNKGFTLATDYGMDAAAGFLGDGDSSRAFVHGGLGAQASPLTVGGKVNGDGGFGGGGALRAEEFYATTGGGGGYSGGGAGDSTNGFPFWGGGGGSFNAGANPQNQAGGHTGYGKVEILPLQ